MCVSQMVRGYVCMGLGLWFQDLGLGAVGIRTPIS